MSLVTYSFQQTMPVGFVITHYLVIELNNLGPVWSPSHQLNCYLQLES